jgi:hypothetical protein
MKTPTPLLVKLGLASLLFALSTGIAPAQTSLAETFVKRLTAQIDKLEKSCRKDIKKFCANVTPGEGRMVYCMQAYEDKISPDCAFELPDAVVALENANEVLKEAVNACRADIAGVCGKVQPGQGRIAACLIENRTTVAKSCADAIAKVEAAAGK